jgi:hypothetical protein
MALTERSRSALFRGLSEVLDDEEAVGELLSYFPTRDVDEPASRDFVDARIANVESHIAALEARISGVDGRVDALDARMRAGFESVDARMQAGFAEQREAMASALHAEIRGLTRWAVGTIVAMFGLLIGLGFLR